MGTRVGALALVILIFVLGCAVASCGSGDSATGGGDASASGTVDSSSGGNGGDGGGSSGDASGDASGASLHAVGGTVSGLAAGRSGPGVVLQINGGESVTVAADGPFVFPTKLASGAAFAVTVATQPQGPAQTCAVAGGSGVVGSGDVTAVTVTCSVNTYAIGGTVVGLKGAGLVLRDNGGDDLTIAASDGGSTKFSFATKVPSGGAFAVTVRTQPTGPTQTCSVSGGTGNVTAGDVSSVTVNCTTNSYTVGGTVTGLVGSVVLQDDGANDLTVNANGSFAFPVGLPSGAAYAVTVLTQPPSPAQTCIVSQGTGTIASANVTSVAVNCFTDTFPIHVTVNGLSGTGLLLQNNGGDNLAVTSGGVSTFATPVASGQPYAVTIATQPTGPSQTCAVQNGAGTVTNAAIAVVVNCTTDKYTVGGAVNGLLGAGLVLQDNLADDLGVTAPGGPFTFATQVASGQPYGVTVLTQPTSPWQTCAVTNGAGTVGAANVTNVAVQCTTSTFTIGGTVSGMPPGATLVLQDNGADNVAVTANGNFVFPTAVASGQTYAVAVLTPVPLTLCAIASGTGTVAGANVTNVTVTCTLSCGNGALDPGEQCDDGNTIDTDACSNTCTNGPILLAGTSTTYIANALTALGETFTLTVLPTAGAFPPASGKGTIILSNDGFNGTTVDYTPHLAAGAHVVTFGGSNFAPYTTWLATYLATDVATNGSAWHQSNDCTQDFNQIGNNPILRFLPATYEFITTAGNESTTFHMLHFPAAQPSGAAVIARTCHNANPGIVATRAYPSQGTFTSNAFDLGAYTDASAQAGFVAPFLKGMLLYLRSPH
jgi:cysteine-rich repeat protein